MQDFKNLTVWQMARQLTKSANWNAKTILSFDLAFITEAMREEILDKLIQIKRMLSSLANRLLGSIEKQRQLRRLNKEAAKRAARIPVTSARADSLEP